MASDLGDVRFDVGKFTVQVRGGLKISALLRLLLLLCAHTLFITYLAFTDPTISFALLFFYLLYDAVAKHGANAENHAQESQVLFPAALVSNHGNVVVHLQETVFNARERAD